MLRALLVLIPVSGCSLYFGDTPSGTTGDDDARPSPEDGGSVSANQLARPCIHTLVAGHLAAPLGMAAPGGSGLITYTCTGSGSVVEAVVDSGGGIAGYGARADYQPQFTRTILDDIPGLDSGGQLSVIAVGSPTSMWIFTPNAGHTVAFERPFSDLWIGDLDGDQQRDFVAVGDGAVRVASAYSQTYGFPLDVVETELFSGKPFRWLAVSDFAGSTAPDILYVTDNAGDIELDLATQTQASPLAFDTRMLAHLSAPGAADPALVVTDIDGDGKPDVIGAANDLWIYSTRAGALYTWPAHAPRAIAGGHGEFVYADQGTIYRGSIDGGVLHVDPLFADPAVDALAVGDLDGNGHDDVLALHGIDTPDSVVVRYPR